MLRRTLAATRWPLAALAFLVAFNAKAGAVDAPPPPAPPSVTLTST